MGGNTPAANQGNKEEMDKRMKEFNDLMQGMQSIVHPPKIAKTKKGDTS